jgi:hypothetical protein
MVVLDDADVGAGLMKLSGLHVVARARARLVQYRPRQRES